LTFPTRRSSSCKDHRCLGACSLLLIQTILAASLAPSQLTRSNRGDLAPLIDMLHSTPPCPCPFKPNDRNDAPQKQGSRDPTHSDPMRNTHQLGHRVSVVVRKRQTAVFGIAVVGLERFQQMQRFAGG
jgi:hypothetical protein